MPNNQNAFAETLQFDQAASVATILPSDTAMPMACDACDEDSVYSIGFLHTLPTLTCKHCGDQRQFSAFEYKIINNFLKDKGYFLAKSA